MTGLLHKAGRYLFGYDAVESKNRRQAPTGRLRFSAGSSGTHYLSPLPVEAHSSGQGNGVLTPRRQGQDGLSRLRLCGGA